MELKTIYGDIIFALEGAKTVLEVVKAAIEAKKSLRSADLRSADLSGADLRGADLRSANLSGAELSSADLRSAELSSADLRSANLSGAHLSGADLRSANLSGANLSSADLSSAELSRANLSGADLSSADLRGANLSGADLRSADLSSANLSRANLYCANLSGAELSSADLRSANLSGAHLSSAKNAELAIAMVQFIPTEGSFVGWKKCRDGVVVKLWIGKTAKRSHGGERKCRASRVKVAEVFGAEEGISMHDDTVIYRKGHVIEPLNGWDENRWNVCAPGIHFFITREEAEAYQG